MGQASITTGMALFAVAVGGALLGPQLVRMGLRQLRLPGTTSRGVLLAGGAAAAVGGLVAALAAQRTSTPWSLPALVLWGYALGSLATIDALTRRVPTPLCRQATALMALLLFVADAATGDWRGLSIAAAAALFARLILRICVALFGAGYGDARIAVLGGLGLGHVTSRGLIVGLSALAIVLIAQAVVALRASEDAHRQIPLGPALCGAFLLAAAI